MFSCSPFLTIVLISGTSVVWTGVTPPPIPTPPQNLGPPIRGEVGKSFWVLAVNRGELCAAVVLTFVFEDAKVSAALCSGRGAGGGRLMGPPRPSRRAFLRVAISWRRARFSDS